MRSLVVLPIAFACAVASVAHGSTPQCICVTRLHLVTPFRAGNASLDAHVRITTMAGSAPDLVLRVHKGKEVAFTKRAASSSALLTVIELVPTTPLEPRTRYEVGVVDPEARPSTTVFGTFTTGDARDTVAPRLDRPGSVTAHHTPGVVDSCERSEPRVSIEGLAASDPGRPDAQLSLAVWRGTASGAIDDTKAPDVLFRLDGGPIVIGGTTLCYAHPLPLASTGPVWLGIAVVDEAGNRSAIHRHRADMTGALP